MATFEVYPKIRGLHKCPELFDESEVIITEKIHGKNMRVMIPENAQSTDDIIVGAREHAEDHPAFGLQSEARMLKKILNLNKLLDYFQKENQKVIIFGELYGLGVQQNIRYREDKGFIVFDMMKGDEFIDFDDLKSICTDIGLEVVPVLYKGKPNKDIFDAFINVDSVLAKNHSVKQKTITEGVVIRSNPLRKNQYDEFIICKYKSNWALEEKVVKKTKNLSLVYEFTERFVTKIRVEKMIDKLKEKSLFTGTMKDIFMLGKEVADDILIEEKDEFNKVITEDKSLNERIVRNKITSKTAKIYREILGLK
tara:strand:- start:722 stop:1651 length:930 start_codon:yes stop_codon:yes gene_type:complete